MTPVNHQRPQPNSFECALVRRVGVTASRFDAEGSLPASSNLNRSADKSYIGLSKGTVSAHENFVN
jgi:hypothetical protein